MPSPLDFRFLDEGLGGQNKKRKRVEENEPEAMSVEPQECREGTPGGEAVVAMSTEGSGKRLKVGDGKAVNVNVGKVSGRNWKDAKPHRASTMRTAANYRGKVRTKEERERERVVAKAYRERKEGLKEEIRASKRERRQKAEERKKRREEGALKGAKIQIIKNPKTLKKMSKKQLKQLVKVPG